MARTTDGGATWTETAPASSSGSQGLSGLFFVDENNGWASTGSRIYRTTDGGASWSGDFRDPGGANDYRRSARNGAIYGAKYEGGNNGSVQISTDDGASWTTAYYGCAAARSGAISPDGTLYMIGGDGGHIRKIDLTITSIADEIQSVNKLHAFPNPSSGELSVRLDDNTGSGIVSLDALNGSTIFTKKITANSQVIDLNLTHIQKGMHILRWTDNDQSILQTKVILH